MHISTPLDSMELPARRDARTYSRSMLLKGGPTSPEGSSLVARIVDEVVSPHKAAKGQLRPSSVAKYHAVTGAFLADLLVAADAGRWSKRETNTNALTGVPGGPEAFRTMREAMGRAGLLEELPGYVRPYTVFGHEYTQAARTSFRPSEKLLELAASHGVLEGTVRQHFSLGEVKPPVAAEVLEARADKKGEKGKEAKRLPIDPSDPKVAEMVAAMQRLNAHLMEPGRIEGIVFAGLRRVFSNADRPGFAWQWHGRFYSMPEANAYELMEGGRASRCDAIRIDGQEVAEVDISASHLTILHGLLELAFDPQVDPYEVDGVERERFKRWLVAALGAGNAAAGGKPFNKVRAAALSRYPFLRDLAGLGYGTLDLQFHEAEILRLAMAELVEKGVGFLPVHDALLVARCGTGLAQDALRSAFQRYFVGVLGRHAAPSPRLSTAFPESS